MTEPSEEENELEVLDPDVVLDIDGERVVVREFRYGEGMRLMPRLQPILEILRSLCNGDRDPEDLSVYDEIVQQHGELMLELVAAACDRTLEWVEALPDNEGYRLQTAFWRANAGFFMRRLFLTSPKARAAAAAMQGRPAETSASES